MSSRRPLLRSYSGNGRYGSFNGEDITSTSSRADGRNYSCTPEDAAIYQASARNSRGIVSCSGVLEVGAMNEFKIHQRFFAKVKQKADAKRKDLEQSRQRGRETARHTATEQPHTTRPIQVQRRIRSPSEPRLTLPSSTPEAKLPEQPLVAAETSITNGFAVHQEPVKENGKPSFLYVRGKVEIITTRPATKDSLAKKMIKIMGVESDGPKDDSAGDGSLGNEKEVSNGGMSLARYLTESSKLDPSGNQRDTTCPEEASKPWPATGHQGAIERGNAKQNVAPRQGLLSLSAPEEMVVAQVAAQKEPELPNALTSMFFSLRDMFFRNKNKHEDAMANRTDAPHVHTARTEEKEPPSILPLPHPEPPQTPQWETGGKMEAIRTPVRHTEPAKADRASPSANLHVKGPLSAETQTPEPQADPTVEEKQGSRPSPGVTVRSVASPAGGAGVGDLAVPASCLNKPAPIQPQVAEWSWSPETVPMPQPPSETEVAVDRMQKNGIDAPASKDLPTSQREQHVQPSASTAEHVWADDGEMCIMHKHNHSASEHLSENTQSYSNGLDVTQTEPSNGLQKSALNGMGESEDTVECQVTPVVDPHLVEPADAAVEKDDGIRASVMENRDSNLRSQDDTAAFVQEPAEMEGTEIQMNTIQKKEMDPSETQGCKGVTDAPAVVEEKVVTEGKEILMNVAPKIETGGLSGAQREKGEATVSTEPTAVPVKLPDATQPGEVLQTVPIVPGNVTDATEPPEPEPEPERLKLELILPEVPRVLDRISVPKLAVQESQAEEIIEPPTPFTDSASAILEQSILKRDAMEFQLLVVAESRAVPIPMAPMGIAGSNGGHSPPKEIQKAEQDQEAKTGAQEAATEANSVPVISVSFQDGSGLSKTDTECQLNSVKMPIVIRSPPKVPTFVVPPISTICVDSVAEENLSSKDEVKELDSLVTLLQGVKSDLDSCVIPSIAEVTSTSHDIEKNTTTKKSSILENTRVVPLGITMPEPIGIAELPSIVSESPLENPLPHANVNVSKLDKEQQPKEFQAGSDTHVDRLQKDKLNFEKYSLTGPELPPLSPTIPRRCPARGTPGIEAPGLLAVPIIQVDSALSVEKQAKDGAMGDALPPPVPSCESSPQLRRRDSLTPIPSATPEELASGARRKLFIPKPKGEEVEGLLGATDTQPKKDEAPKRRKLSQEQETPYTSPGQSRRPSLLHLPAGQQTPSVPKRSPLLGRKKTTLEVPKRTEEKVQEPGAIKTEPKSAEKDKLDPLKAPQVIRKIRAEPFPDTAGHLKLWCQFFSVRSDSTITWYRDELKIAVVNRSAGDESQVALAVVQASSRDCGVYGCSISNEYGTDSTDFLLSADLLSEFLLREDLEVGEEVEMTPMVFTRGLADPGNWGNKFFGRIMIVEWNIGEGCTRKACRVKVIYGLAPVFASGSICVIKVQSPIAYGKKDKNNLVERNLEITKQECKVQNMIREYCKVFTAEARVTDNFGLELEVIPLYLMYQPANTIPYATVEADLKGLFLKYCLTDSTGRLIMRTGSEVEQKCCTFQHWIHQWTNGNLLLTHLEGVDGKITNVGVATKLKGYQGLSDRGTPKVFEQFVAQHQCNNYCGLLCLQSLKVVDSMMQPTKLKGSRSPMLNRRGSASPQLLRKGGTSPQNPRKVSSSPKLARKLSEPGDGSPAVKHKTVEVPKLVR
ncbi:hypothetical protein AAFF_G00285710 [Aldrovandia affinis]|uniref:non-specific serine/threonine protein kinase n=1 Tax=Aldrovandia affinis TaxID=143900 RepID=A0AAD7X2S3_9TELE|nr:hypothetical protein AAFF_G00285710 [Aldrovandia affinis]